MTSSEFAARYRLLKNVASRGARSFLAQQVELGRMVMVHYLDAESADQQAQTLARLGTLRGSGRDKLLEIADVDGTPVAVTLFISSFVDFTTWLDHVSEPTPAPAPVTPVPGDFTRAFNKVEKAETTLPPVVKPAAPAVAKPAAPRQEQPTPAVAPTAKTPGEFTRIFGKVEGAAKREAEPVPDAADAPTLIMEAVKPPAKAATVAAPEPRPEPAAPAPAADSSSGFTAIFGRVAAMPASPPPSDFSLSASSPLGSSLTSGERVMPPAPPVPDFSQPAAPPASVPVASSEPGEFTQLFQRLSPGGGTSAASVTPPSLFAALPVAPEIPRSIEATPRADVLPPIPNLPPAPSLMPPPVPAPSLGVPGSAPSLGVPPLPVPSLGSLGTPVSPSGPRLPDVPAMVNAPTLSAPPPSAPSTPPAWNGAALPNVGSLFNGGAGQSEFTRVLGRVPAAPPPPVSIQPPSAAPSAPQKPAKSMMPLIVALNAVVLLTIAIVAYFIIRK